MQVGRQAKKVTPLGGTPEISGEKPPKINTTQKREPAQVKLLQAIESEIDGRLRQSLYNAVWLTLGMERRDSAVSPPWEKMWWQPEKPPQPLPAGTRVLDVFDKPEIKQQLLILGEPGSGKTTTMLELARDLLEKAKEDSSQPIPVLVSLSSWKKPEVGIFEWLVAELKTKYGLRQDLGKAWIQNRVLLPLLDGLDEVNTSLQQKCAGAMNAWLTGELENRPCGVLVCCRREEFEKIVQKPLSLQGAIYLQALTPAQIEEYFLQFELLDVWQTVWDDAVLRELLAKPLFLSMFGLVQIQGKFELAMWRARATSEEKIEYLFDTYWEAVMSRELILPSSEDEQGIKSKTYGKHNPPSKNKVLKVLIFTAKSLNSECQAELALEYMQPSWLLTEEQKITYTLVVITTLVALALIVSIILYFSVGEATSSILIMTIYGRIFFKRVDLIIPVEKLKAPEWIEFLSSVDTKTQCKLIFRVGGILRLVVYSVACIIWLFNKLDAFIGYSLALAFMGMVSNCLANYLFDFYKTKLDYSNIVNSGIKNSCKNITGIIPTIFIIGLVFAYSIQWRVTAFINLETNFQRNLLIAFMICLAWNAAIEVGGRSVIQHLSLRFVLWFNGYIPRRYDLFLDYCTERLLLQRIGGRYRFMHKLLQDHFAKMELD